MQKGTKYRLNKSGSCACGASTCLLLLAQQFYSGWDGQKGVYLLTRTYLVKVLSEKNQFYVVEQPNIVFICTEYRSFLMNQIYLCVACIQPNDDACYSKCVLGKNTKAKLQRVKKMQHVMDKSNGFSYHKIFDKGKPYMFHVCDTISDTGIYQ